MPKRTPGQDLLETWKEIAVYLDRDIRTAKRWERSRALPVHRLPGGPKSAVYASKSEVDKWRQGGGLAVHPMEPAETAKRRPVILWAAGSVALLLAAGLIVWRLTAPKLAPTPHRVPVTNYRGVEWFPAFSPDGKQIAFSWNGEHEDNYDIYVKLVNLGNPLRLTTNPAMDLAPVWSPDGRHIAFVRWTLGAPKVEYFIIPALGGAERRVAEDSITPNAIGIPVPVAAWTPDGTWLIKGVPRELRLVSIDNGDTRRVTSPPADSPGDCCPVISPDGRTLAFLRASVTRSYNPMVLNIASNGEPLGEPRQLESPSCTNPLWSGDGSELFCVAGGDEDRTLWRVPVRTKGTARPLPSIGALGRHLAISPRGDRLIYSNFTWEGDIWQLGLSGHKPPARLIASTADELRPQFSPDGGKIAFLSNRSGHLAIWISDRDSANASELVAALPSGAPSWSPNGQQIAYTCRVSGGSEDICAIGSAGGKQWQLTKDPARDLMPNWSRDGRWIYFTSDRSGTFQIWKTPADGTGPAIQVTRNGGYGGIESADGRFLYYARTLMSSPIWRIPVQGGDEVSLGDDVRSLRLPQNFAVGENGIFYASSPDPAARFELRFFSFSSKRTEFVARIEGGLGNGMSLSPDGRTLLFCVEQRSGDLVMVENFQ